MSQSPPPGWRPGPDEERPSWMGAPGYQPHQELPPHAPMPGAPPYPAGIEPDPAPVGRPGPRTSYPLALGATSIGAALQLVILLALAGPPPSSAAFGAVVGSTVVPTALGSLVLWLIARKRAWPFWLLAIVGVVIYFAIRLLATASRLGAA
ncbi:hypothetical protein [Pseudonocardia humida]|uniref:Uncharacterized protein n=1 Tax=Pseudonocardia humida TaxID=2800819 RepID=A0ABT0ZZ28_9PSEU|nr:hypothetical protein [Pseudonocardia humida]MCO1655961.1 hypothetical protein [Pseudonocardia humida]